MTDTPMQIAKREMQTLFSSRITWICLGAAGLILGLTGPFGTNAYLGLLGRLVYWLVVATVSFGLGSVISTVVSEVLRARNVTPWLAVVCAGALAGIANFGALLMINWLVFRIGLEDTDYLVGLAINAVVISIIVAGAVVSIHSQIEANDQSSTGPVPARILERLPLEKRGALISLSVQDHYTEVVTTSGSELVLLRLSDAIAEVGDTPGLQVHRSHWVATKAVKAATRDGARAILTMADGREIPAARSYVAALKTVGILPK